MPINELEILKFEFHATGTYTPPPQKGTAELNVPAQKIEENGNQSINNTSKEI